MTKLEKYNSYKNSAVEWLGDIPEHWEVKKLKYLSAIKTGYTPDTTKSENYSEDGIVWVKPDELREFNLIIDSKEKINKNRVKKQNIIQKDSILVNCIGNIGKFGIAGIELVTNQQINSVTFNSYIYNKFGKYLIFVSKDEHFKHSNGNVVQILNVSSQSQIILPIPPKEEQEKIANYLDKKTAQIDKAISQKQKLIELLKEQKQIVINDAVTKGLDKDVEFVDSGVEWIGKIPKHWEISKLGTSLKPISIKNRADLPLLSVTREQGVILRDVDDKESNHNFIPDDLSGYKMVEKGQFAMNKMKAWQGSYGISDYTGIVSPAYFIFELNGIESTFFHKAIRSSVYVPFFIKASDGVRIGQWDLSKSRMKEIPFYIPPKDEQLQIVEYIENQTTKIDKAIELEQNYISKLKEYKATLIDSVVTGKVRVS
ncbi:MAG: restriction endonuclease subunit S [Arcobacteraceae bacterium]